MKVLELLAEIEDIIDTASGFPLTGKIMIDADELREIVKEIRAELPSEFEQAQYIKQQQGQILTDAKDEYESVIRDARRQAEVLIDTNDITIKAKQRAEEIIRDAEEKAKQLKLGTYEYMDGILFDFQSKMEEMNAQYFVDMFNNLENTFNGVSDTLQSNREEIQSLAYELAGDPDAAPSRDFNMDVVLDPEE